MLIFRSGCSSVRATMLPLAAVVALAVAGQSPAATSSEIFTPATAVTISSGAFPAAGRLSVGRSPDGDVFRTLIGFDAPALDPADITDATLVLTEAECVEGDVAAFRTTSSWDGLVAWSSQPDVDREHPVPGRRESSCLGTSLTFDVTDEVRAWLEGPPEALGLEIRGDEGADVVRLFDGEGGTPPYLVLAFADETPPPPDPDPGPGSDGTGDLYPAVVSAQLSDAPATTDGDGSLRVGRSGGGERERVLLDFGLPAIDVDELWNATLVLSETGCDPAAAPVVAYQVTSVWSADAVGWTAQPTLGSSIGTLPAGGCDGWMTLDVTEVVRRWSTGAWAPFGIALVGDESRAGTERRFASGADPDGPYVVVNGSPLFPGAGSPPPPPPAVAGAPPILVRGVVVEAGGAPVAGASVDVFLFGEPSSTSVPRLAHAVTDAEGAFAVRLPLSDPGVADAARPNGDWADFELLVGAGVRSYPRVFSRGIGSVEWLADEEDRTAGEDPLRIQLDSLTAIAAGSPGVRTFQTSAATLASGCPGYQVTLLGTQVQPTKVGQMQIYNDAYMSFAYGERAHSSIEVMVSRNGGAFAVYGLVHRGTGESSSVGTSRDFRGQNATFGKWFRTNFEYRKIRTRFDCQNTHWVEDSISAKRWIGGFDLIGDLTHLNGRCGNDFKRYRQGYGKGWLAHQGTRLKKYGLGASAFGVGVGAQSYGARWVAWKYNFGTRYEKHWLCGDTDYPIKAKTVYAGL